MPSEMRCYGYSTASVSKHETEPARPASTPRSTGTAEPTHIAKHASDTAFGGCPNFASLATKNQNGIIYFNSLYIILKQKNYHSKVVNLQFSPSLKRTHYTGTTILRQCVQPYVSPRNLPSKKIRLRLPRYRTSFSPPKKVCRKRHKLIRPPPS